MLRKIAHESKTAKETSKEKKIEMDCVSFNLQLEINTKSFTTQIRKLGCIRDNTVSPAHSDLFWKDNFLRSKREFTFVAKNKEDHLLSSVDFLSATLVPSLVKPKEVTKLEISRKRNNNKDKRGYYHFEVPFAPVTQHLVMAVHGINMPPCRNMPQSPLSLQFPLQGIVKEELSLNIYCFTFGDANTVFASRSFEKGKLISVFEIQEQSEVDTGERKSELKFIRDFVSFHPEAPFLACEHLLWNSQRQELFANIGMAGIEGTSQVFVLDFRGNLLRTWHQIFKGLHDSMKIDNWSRVYILEQFGGPLCHVYDPYGKWLFQITTDISCCNLEIYKDTLYLFREDGVQQVSLVSSVGELPERDRKQTILWEKVNCDHSSDRTLLDPANELIYFIKDYYDEKCEEKLEPICVHAWKYPADRLGQIPFKDVVKDAAHHPKHGFWFVNKTKSSFQRLV